MKKLIKTFFTYSFIIFCVIGVLNTIIHLIVFNLVRSNVTDLSISLLSLLANTTAFIVASIFSYWANASFTYKKKMDQKSFWLSMLTFTLKLILSNALTLMFEWMFVNWNLDYLIPWIPIPVTCVLLPLQFLVFNRIFKKNDHHAL